MKRSVYFFLMCMFAALAVGCGDDDDGGKNAGNNGGGSSASARAQGRQPQTRQKKQLGKPKPLRR